MRLLVTRPEPDAIKLQAVLEAMGHEATVEPLLSVSFEAPDAIELDGVQALIATSRNALRALRSTAMLARARLLPLFTVGKATAAEARALGFEMVVAGAGTGRELIAQIVSVLEPAAGLLVHLAGDKLAVDLKGELEPHGFRVATFVVYRMRAATGFADEVVEQLAMGEIDGVILLSPRTAAVYARLVAKHALAASVRPLLHFCLSAAVARRLVPLGEVAVLTASVPTLEEVLALIAETAAKLED
ncbi:MAG TPA: uroporphyrinogen-III synthase [Hyphomicrobiaceae bacterium]|nr:uroporphyrinogen-III synthase [Hyphomicrobiaceae bacterium]